MELFSSNFLIELILIILLRHFRNSIVKVVLSELNPDWFTTVSILFMQ